MQLAFNHVCCRSLDQEEDALEEREGEEECVTPRLTSAEARQAGAQVPGTV